MKLVIYLLLIALLFSFCAKKRNFITHSEEKGELIKTIDGVNLWVALLGKGEPLFLIPGGPGASHVYLHDFDSLKDSNLLVFIDFYGRGQSDTAFDSTSYTIQRDVDDVDNIRKALGFEKINVLGHSFGSVIAQQYSIRHQAQVEHLIIANGFYSGRMFQDGLDNMNQISKNESVDWDLLYYYDTTNKKKEYHDPNYPNNWNNKVYYQFLGPQADSVVKMDFLKFDITKNLKNFKMPVLFLAGSYDRMSLPDSANRFKEYCPQAAVDMFYQSGHNPQVEEHQKVIADIKKFLGR